MTTAFTPATQAAPRRPMRTSASSSVQLLSRFRLVSAGDVIRLPYSLERVIAYLALAHGPVGRSRLAGVLWPDIPERHAHGALRSALWRLQRLCGVIERDERVLELAANVAVSASPVSGNSPER